MDANFWDNRYNEEGFAYGNSPNVWFESNISYLKPNSKLLFPAEGEGRNAVFAAQQGFECCAFDVSAAGKEKALLWAKELDVQLDYQVGALEELEFELDSFDGIVLSYAHLPYPERIVFHKKLLSLLKTDGFVIFEAFAKEQLDYQSGGPKVETMLFSLEEVMEEFEGLQFIIIQHAIVKLEEGKYHQGEGAVIRFVGQKLRNY